MQASTQRVRTVEGRLLMGDFAERDYQCRVHPTVGPPVTCTFGEAHKEAVLRALLKLVRITGEATERGGRVTRLRISDIEALQEDDGAAELGASTMGFEETLTSEELAARQGVGPVTDFDALWGDFWPEDESVDDFVAAVREWRRDDPARRRLP